MKYKVFLTKSFQKDLKRIQKRKCKIEELNNVIDMLTAGQSLPEKYHDHQLVGNLKKFRECHIRPDWLLIYQKIDEKLILVLSRTGSHSDLLK